MSPRSFWAAVVTVLVLSGILIVEKRADGWDARQWLIGGGIVLWAIGPAFVGGLAGAHIFCRARQQRWVRTATVGCSLITAMLTALVTAVVMQPDAKVQFRPSSRFLFASDLGMLFAIQTMMGTMLGGYCASYAVRLHERHGKQKLESPDHKP